MKHELKVWEEFFEPLKSSEKNFEVRKDDRDFRVGDILHLRRFDNEDQTYTGDSIFREVEYILRGGQFGIEKGYVVMGLKQITS